MEENLIDITASEIAESGYCEVSWGFSNMRQDDASIAGLKKDLVKGSISHQEQIRVEEKMDRLVRQKHLTKAVIILFALGALIYLLYSLWR